MSGVIWANVTEKNIIFTRTICTLGLNECGRSDAGRRGRLCAMRQARCVGTAAPLLSSSSPNGLNHRRASPSLTVIFPEQLFLISLP